MSQHFSVHPTHPQPRLVRQAAEIVRKGGLIAYPTDSCYALGCHIGDKDAMDRLRDQIRRAEATKMAGATSLAGLTPEMRDALRGLLRRPGA